MANCLIDLTVHQAIEQSEYYDQTFADIDPDFFVNAEKLSELPILTRQKLQEAGTSIRSKFSEYAFSSYTTGTTSGVPLILDRSTQEQLYLSTFFIKLMVNWYPKVLNWDVS